MVQQALDTVPDMSNAVSDNGSGQNTFITISMSIAMNQMSLMGGSLLLLSLLCIAGSVDVCGEHSTDELPSDDWVNKRMSEFKHECDQIRVGYTAPMSPDVLHMTFTNYYEPGKQVCKAIAKMGDGTDIFSSDDAKKLITNFMWTLPDQGLGDKGIAHYTALLFSYKTVMSLPKFWGLKGERKGF